MQPAAEQGGTSADGTGVPPAVDARTVGSARMAGWSGMLFALLVTAALVLVRLAPGLAPDSECQAFYARGSGGVLVALGLYVVPFAGIACLWHMIATGRCCRCCDRGRGRRSRTG